MPDVDPPASPTAYELGLGQQYLRFILCNTIVTRIFGIDAAVDRAMRVSLRAWNAISQYSRPSFYNFLLACFPHLSREQLQEYETDGVPRDAIPLFLSECNFDAPNYCSVDAERPWFHIIDVVAPAFSRLIPSTLFIPYKTRSSQRCRQVLDRINPIPLWFFDEEGRLGFPIENAYKVRLLRGGDELRMNSQAKPVTTLKIKFNWPNYEPLEKQVRASSNAPLNNLNRLATLTAGAVRNFMSDDTLKVVKGNNREPHLWRIGTLPGEIGVDDVVLLGVIFVSDGALMPLLALKQ